MITEATPGTRKASILFGVCQILDTRYVIPRKSTGMSKVWVEKESVFLTKIFREKTSSKRQTPKIRMATLGTSKGLAKIPRTATGTEKRTK